MKETEITREPCGFAWEHKNSFGCETTYYLCILVIWAYWVESQFQTPHPRLIDSDRAPGNFCTLIWSQASESWLGPCAVIDLPGPPSLSTLFYHIIHTRTNSLFLQGQKMASRHLTKEYFTNNACETNGFPAHSVYFFPTLSIFQDKSWIHHNSWILTLDKLSQILSVFA